MENTEIMEIMNEDAVEVVEEIVPTNSGLGWKILGGAAVIAGLACGAVKLIKILKAKKAEKVVEEFDEARWEDVEEVSASEEN